MLFFKLYSHFKDTTGLLPVCSSTGLYPFSSWDRLFLERPACQAGPWLVPGDGFQECSHLTIPHWQEWVTCLNSLYQQCGSCWTSFHLGVWNLGEPGSRCPRNEPPKEPWLLSLQHTSQVGSISQVSSRLLCDCTSWEGTLGCLHLLPLDFTP